ncbi:unnamed protein product [Rotaria socialis]
MNNTTFLLVEQNKPLELTTIYDSSDAIAYIVVVIFWYSSCILFLLIMQMVPSAGVVEHSSKYSNALLNKSFREKTDNKQILEELADKEKRDKLWDIYFNRSQNMSKKRTRRESCSIRDIQRRLATIDQRDQDFNETVQLFHQRSSLAVQYTSSNRSKSPMEKRSDTRRHSWIDPRSFEEWRKTISNFTLDEKYPRAIQKLVFWIILLVNRSLFVKTAFVNESALQDEQVINNNLTLIEDATLAQTTSSGEIDTPSLSIDDVIELNVGGQKITTLRSTLTAVPSSKLARMFSKDNTEKHLPVDQQGAVFFDYNPIYFNYLLDQLRTIKRQPEKPEYQLQFQAPFIGSQLNFTHMLVDLGLTPDHFLSPREGAHINLTISSLAGWKECHRSAYNVPFDLSVLKKSCNGSQLLVACRPVDNKKILTLAGIGDMEDVLHPCLPKQCNANEKPKKKNKKLTCSGNHQCITQSKRGVGWYNANNQTWGFVRGSLSFMVNPCDASDLDSDYRLCWTSQPVAKQNAGDRCGNAQNLQNSIKWERLIYYTV